MTDSRTAAFGVLLKIEESKAYSNIAVDAAVRENRLSPRDSALLSALVYGVLERRLTLDEIIRQYSKIPLRKIELKTKLILRMGLLQLLFMDKIPDSAAVNESVNLAKRLGLRQSAGFINGILRSVTRAEVKYTLPDKSEGERYLSLKYSVPAELVRLWLNSYGENNAEKLCESLSGRPHISVRVNTLKTNTAALISSLESEGVECREAFLENALLLDKTGSIERLDSFRNGLFHVQDLSSQLCVNILDPKPRHTLHDVCSAPGGKSLTAAQLMKNRGRIFSCDMYPHKLNLIKKSAERLGVDIITPLERDASCGKALPTADRILCDVPCSGLGVLSRKPEIRYKDNLLDSGLPEIQYKILCRSAEGLCVGGRLVYSTCTLNPEENNRIAERFLAEHPDFRGVKLNLPGEVSRAFDEKDYEITLMPHSAGTDGFYIAAFTRRAK